MPAIASGDQNRVDICPREQLAQISIESTISVAVLFINQFLSRISARSLHISDSDTSYVFHR